jgi:hypothetical protein
VPKFRKKPVEIEAVQWDGTATGATPIIDWVLATGERSARYDDEHEPVLQIDTLEGTMRASAGDWIIRGVKGEFYPCKPDIFEATYEPVTGGPDVRYLVSFTIAVEAEGVQDLVDHLAAAVQHDGLRDAIGSTNTDYFTVSVNEQPPDEDEPEMKCETCRQRLPSSELVGHMDGHGINLRDEIANAEIVDLTGDPM